MLVDDSVHDPDYVIESDYDSNDDIYEDDDLVDDQSIILRGMFDFSSLEHNMLMVSFSDRPPSVVCPQQFIKKTSPPTPLSQFQPNFIGKFLG